FICNEIESGHFSGNLRIKLPHALSNAIAMPVPILLSSLDLRRSASPARLLLFALRNASC
ncbi:MAG TPA: hypothetical protein VGI42_00250, partial [Chthoniobacterales bacterium]